MEARSGGRVRTPEEKWQRARHIAAAAALSLAVLIVLYLLLFRGGGGYKVTAAFENASQLVKATRSMSRARPWDR
jgi:ABC-type transporter Mla subunit MlaD